MKKLLLLLALFAPIAWAAAPAVDSFATSVEATNVGTHDVSMPAIVDAGELLLMCFSYENADAAPTVTATGWTQLSSDFRNPGGSLAVLYKTAVGDEDSTTVTVTTAAEDVQSAHYTAAISNWDGNTPEYQTANGVTENPDPPSITPAGGSDDYLIQTCVGIDFWRTVSAYPSGYSDTGTEISNGASGDAVTLGYASLGLSAATTEDPGAYTINSSDDWRAITIALTPASSPTVTLSDATPDIDTTVTATLSGAFGAGGNPTLVTFSGGDTVSCSSATSTTCDFPLNFSALVAAGDLGTTKVQAADTITVTNGTETSQTTAINIQIPASGYAIVDLTCTAGTDCSADSEAIVPMIANDDCAIKVTSGTLDHLSTECAPVFLTGSFSYTVARFDESAVAWLAQESVEVTAPVSTSPRLKMKGVRMNGL